GEMRHMLEQARFGKACGVPNTLVQKNGQVVRLAPGEPRILSEVTSGRLVLDGDMIMREDSGVLNERRRLSQTGHIVVAVSGRNAQVVQRGLPVDADDLDKFLKEASAAAEKAAKSGDRNVEKRRESVRLAVRRCATDWTGKKPLVDVLLLND
ncbi:MAG: MBL fold metallo-hydrolase, partial [Sphingopyxis sp.]